MMSHPHFAYQNWHVKWLSAFLLESSIKLAVRLTKQWNRVGQKRGGMTILKMGVWFHMINSKRESWSLNSVGVNLARQKKMGWGNSSMCDPFAGWSLSTLWKLREEVQWGIQKNGTGLAQKKASVCEASWHLPRKIKTYQDSNCQIELFQYELLPRIKLEAEFQFAIQAALPTHEHLTRRSVQMSLWDQQKVDWNGPSATKTAHQRFGQSMIFLWCSLMFIQWVEIIGQICHDHGVSSVV